MGPQITVSAHALVEMRKPYKIGLGNEILETGFCFKVLNGMKGHIIQESNMRYRSEPQYIFLVVVDT